MITHDNMVCAVEKYIEAFDLGDAEMVVSLFADNATVEDPIGANAITGHAAIRAFYLRSMQTGARLWLEGPVRTTGTCAAFPFSVTLDFDGKKRIDVIDTFTFNDQGKIQEMRAYWGPENMHGFMGE